MIELISAMTANGCIGVDNKLPWEKQRGDMMFFKKTTTGKAVIMGRLTFESLNSKPLPNRVNIVISTTLKPIDGVEVADSLEEAIEIAHKHDMTPVVIGGGTIYNQAINLVDVMYLTTVSTVVEGDTFFPNLELDKWIQQVIEHGDSDERNEHSYTIYKMTRK